MPTKSRLPLIELWLSDNRLSSLTGAVSHRCDSFPAGGGRAHLIKGKPQEALTWNNHVSPYPQGWRLSSNSLDPTLEDI